MLFRSEAETEEPKPKKRRPRGGRRHKKKTTTTKTRTSKKTSEAETPVAAPATEVAPARPTSTDKHLLHDEPVNAPPVYRPRTYRDLDHIPDDLD